MQVFVSKSHVSWQFQTGTTARYFYLVDPPPFTYSFPLWSKWLAMPAQSIGFTLQPSGRGQSRVKDTPPQAKVTSLDHKLLRTGLCQLHRAAGTNCHKLKTELYPLTVLEVRILKSRCWQEQSPSKGSREGYVPCFFQACWLLTTFVIPWCIDTSLQSASIFTWYFFCD